MSNDNGMRLETASSVIARDLIKQFYEKFSFAVRSDRVASQAVVAAFIDGLAGAVALTIAGNHGGRDDVTEATIRKLRDAIDRDLQHLRPQ